MSKAILSHEYKWKTRRKIDQNDGLCQRNPVKDVEEDSIQQEFNHRKPLRQQTVYFN